MAEPRIYSRNWVDAQTSFTLSHGGVTTYLYDRSDNPPFTTSGANSDATSVSITMYFYEAGTPVYRTIDGIFLKNYNWKNWSIKYWDGSSFQSWTSQTNDTQSDRFINIGSSSLDRLQIDIVSTKTANQEKSIGEIVLCGVTLAADDMASYDTKWREKTKEIVLGDGAIHRVITRAVSGRNGRYEARCRWSYLSKAMRDNFKALKESGQPFLWQPESVNVPEEVYYVHWTNAWDDKYMNNFKGAGYEVVMDLKEV